MKVKSLAEDDRPREKNLLKGKEALSDAELLAIIIGSGNIGRECDRTRKKNIKICKQQLASAEFAYSQRSDEV